MRDTTPDPHDIKGVKLTDYDPPRADFACEPASLSELNFRHSGSAQHRRKIFEALQRCHTNSTRLDRFAQCGAHAIIERLEGTDTLRIRAHYCDDRFCIACGTARSRVIADVLALQCQYSRTLFITLTLRHSNTPLNDQLDRLYDSFNKLRRRDIWCDAIKGGAAIIELKEGRDGLWHVHLHILADGSYVPQESLARAWHQITGDSFQVDIKRIVTIESAGKYVAKYASKPCDQSIYNKPEKLDEMITALRGRRLCATFGTWRGVKLHGEPDKVDASQRWITVCYMNDLMQSAEAGEVWALRLLSVLHRADLVNNSPSP